MEDNRIQAVRRLFSLDLLCKTFTSLAGLICCRRTDENRKKQARDERGGGEEAKERGQREQRTEGWKQSERERERDDGETALSSRRAGGQDHLAWAGGSAAPSHTTGTNGGFVILDQLSQLSLSARQPPTRCGIMTIRPPASQMSGEERPCCRWHRIPRKSLA